MCVCACVCIIMYFLGARVGSTQGLGEIMISYSKQYALLIEKKMITENLQASTFKKLLKKKLKLKKVIHFLCTFSPKGTDYIVKLIHVAVIMMRVPELMNSEFPRIIR